MKNLSISRRYAKALMLIGEEDGNADQYRKELDEIVELFDTSVELCWYRFWKKPLFPG